MKAVKAKLNDGYAVTVETRRHVVCADEPVEIGGADSAPKPSELVLSGLASCKIITCKMYAERKGWKIDGIDIELMIDESEPLVILKKMNFLGDIDQVQRDRLKDISGRCPVVRMLNPDYTFKWSE